MKKKTNNPPITLEVKQVTFLECPAIPGASIAHMTALSTATCDISFNGAGVFVTPHGTKEVYFIPLNNIKAIELRPGLPPLRTTTV